ncbi:MAG: hypothetical protein QXR53_01050 [Candidatus Norongarragalinales archaeon]
MIDPGEVCDKANNAGCAQGEFCNFDCSACFSPGSPEGSILRIEGKRVIGGEEIQAATVPILYNTAATGLAAPCSEQVKGSLLFTIDDARLGSIPEALSCDSSKPGVFILTLSPQLLGLQSQELPSGSYRVKVEVDEGGTVYSANDPQALIVVKQKQALPETDFLVVLFFGLLALLFVRSGTRRNE